MVSAFPPAVSTLDREVTAWHAELRAPVLRYLASLGLPVHDAEEVAQEVFLALFEHLRDDKPRDNLRGWIFRVAHNLGIRRRNRARANACGDPDLQQYALDHHPDSAPDPECQAVTRERQQRLLAIFRALPEQDRCCLSLRAEGVRYREIAGILGISLGSVAASMSRALNRLSQVDSAAPKRSWFGRR